MRRLDAGAGGGREHPPSDDGGWTRCWQQHAPSNGDPPPLFSQVAPVHLVLSHPMATKGHLLKDHQEAITASYTHGMQSLACFNKERMKSYLHTTQMDHVRPGNQVRLMPLAQHLKKIHRKISASPIRYCSDIIDLALDYEYMPEGNLQDHLRD